MKILLTGGAGFIGSHIQDKLIEKGHKVIVVDDLSSGKKENINKKARFYKIDIQNPKLKEIFEKEKPDIVNHHAAQINLRKSVDDPMFDAKINILGSINLLENCKNFKVKKIIFASTGGAIYGDADIIPTPETYNAMPSSPYGIAKLSVEHYMHYYDLVHSLPYIALRYGNVYGPRQDPHGEAGVVAIFTQKLLKNEQPMIFGDGEQTRDYIYVGDVVDANMQALEKDVKGSFNIGTSNETSVNDLYKKILAIGKFDKPEEHGPAKPGEQQRSCLDISKSKKDLDWEPKINIEEGLEKTINWFRECS